MPIFDRDLDTFFSAQVIEARRFFYPRGRLARDTIVVGGGLERVDSSYEVSRAAVPFFALEFVVAGSGIVQLGRQEHRLTPGTVFTYAPDLAHRIITDPHRPLIKYFVDARPAPARRLLRCCALKRGQAAHVGRPSEILRLFEDLITTGQRQGPFSQPICDRLFEALLYRVAESALPIGSVEATSFATYQRCARILESRAMEFRSMRQAADACGIDEAYLCRLFRRFDQQSPYRCLMRTRMNHAATLLREGGGTVREVARSVGYGDAFHFSKVFKRVLGLSPTEYMRSRRVAFRRGRA